MQLRTLHQNHHLHRLLAEANLTAEKAALATEFSQGRTARSSELTMAECQALIRHLENGLGLAAPAPTPEQQAATDRMRRKIISLAHDMRWHEPGTQRADMARVNGWCQARGFGKKQLNQYTLDELRKLVSQFKIVHKKYMDELAKTPPMML